MRPLWLSQRVRTERTTGYLTPRGLEAFLTGGVPDPADTLGADDLYAFDHRTGIGVQPLRRTAEEGLIYSASFLALKPGIAFYAELVLPEEAPDNLFEQATTIPFGGEGRNVRAQTVECFRWPEVPAGSGQGTLLLLTTAGVFTSGWRPRCLENDGRLVAASVSQYEAVSGWDLARGGPKPARFAVPAGSVYFVEGPAHGLPGDSLSDSPEDSLQGWGCFARGVWNYV